MNQEKGMLSLTTEQSFHYLTKSLDSSHTISLLNYLECNSPCATDIVRKVFSRYPHKDAILVFKVFSIVRWTELDPECGNTTKALAVIRCPSRNFNTKLFRDYCSCPTEITLVRLVYENSPSRD